VSGGGASTKFEHPGQLWPAANMIELRTVMAMPIIFIMLQESVDTSITYGG
jgi:hypothetical protein